MMVAVFVSCRDSGSDSGIGLNLSRVSVKDAAVIYKREVDSRAGEGETEYWKLDHQGNETRVVCYDEGGAEADVKINNVIKLSEHMLYIATEKGPVLADIRTGKLYQAPNEWWWDERSKMLEAPDGMLYYNCYGMVYQINPQDFTYKPYLPEGQRADIFLVSKKGTCWYGSDFMGCVGKLVLRGGRVYPVDGQQIFLSQKDGMLYSVNGKKIVRWREISDNEIVQEDVCEITQEGMFGFFINGTNGNVVMHSVDESQSSVFMEFDGSSCLVKNTMSEPNWGHRFMSNFFTGFNGEPSFRWEEIQAGQVFFGSDGYSYSLNLSTYELTVAQYEIPSNEYEVYTRQQGFDSMLFSALRYLDGKVVIGEVDKDGQVRIISEQESSAKVTQLIPLN